MVRLAEVIAALSLATDLGMGQPIEFALQSCIVAVRLGEALEFSDEALREVYYQALLRYIGCNVETHLLAAVVGDEFALRSDFAMIDNGNAAEVVRLMTRHVWRANEGVSGFQLVKAIASSLFTLPKMGAVFAGHCEVAQRLGQRLGFEPNIIYALGQLYERWDGKGLPYRLKGEAIAPAVLVVTLAQDAVLFHRINGIDAAVQVARERKGTAYAPYIVDCFCQHAPQLLKDIDTEGTWKKVLALEPGKQTRLTDEQFDNACHAMADFVDIKSPYSLTHSHRVAELAAETASQAGLPTDDIKLIRRAGWLHDIGKTGVSAGILEKTAPLSDREWEQVRLHPYYTERILSKSDALAKIGAVASLHHERLDGSGYHRALSAPGLSPAARILSAANAYCALLEDRPYRPRFSPEQAADTLKHQAHGGKLDPEAVRCVLNAAGHDVNPARRQFTAGLSEREIEVLRLMAHGSTTRQIAEALTISRKTADHHIQHIYNKIGVSTRAGATMFAMENDLLGH